MTSEKLASLQQERDELIEDYMNASRGRLELSEIRLIAIRDRIDRLTRAIVELRNQRSECSEDEKPI